jgi:AraC-like DNA-binding protein
MAPAGLGPPGWPPLSKVVFSSDQLPVGLDDDARLALWCDVYRDTICNFDVSRLESVPFSSTYEFVQVEDLAVVHYSGTMGRVARSRSHIAADSAESIFLSFNGDAPFAISARGTVHFFAPREAKVLLSTEPVDARYRLPADWSGLVLPADEVRVLVPHPEDLAYRPIDPGNEALGHLRRYMDFLSNEPAFDAHAAIAAPIKRVLLDLVALTLGGSRDAVEAARFRGLRAARLQQILAAIHAGYTEPAFSTEAVAMRLRLSANYIQKILTESGASFTERVLELRLHKARAMLSRPLHLHAKVSEIALECGFNDISYFNRCFRRRFGAPPTHYRGVRG